MLMSITLLTAAMQIALNSAIASFDFSRSYVVWATTAEGQCIYFLTDAGEEAKELTETLKRNYDANKGIEILTSDNTPNHCIARARKAVRNAGFTHFRVRRGTDADRSPGIP